MNQTLLYCKVKGKFMKENTKKEILPTSNMNERWSDSALHTQSRDIEVITQSSPCGWTQHSHTDI